LEALFRRAFEQAKPIMVSLSSGKVYVGYLKHLVPTLSASSYIEIIPLFSGYRQPVDPESSNPTQIHFNTYYEDITEIILDSNTETSNFQDQLIRIENDKEEVFFIDPRSIGIALATNQIESATIFFAGSFQIF